MAVGFMTAPHLGMEACRREGADPVGGVRISVRARRLERNTRESSCTPPSAYWPALSGGRWLSYSMEALSKNAGHAS